MGWVIAADVDFTLMRLDPILDMHVQSGVRTKHWFFRVPSSWLVAPTDIDGRLGRVVVAIFDDVAARFRLDEPDDPNYLKPLALRQRTLTDPELVAEPWRSVQPLWEPSTCFVVDDEGHYRPVNPTMFGALA